MLRHLFDRLLEYLQAFGDTCFQSLRGSIFNLDLNRLQAIAGRFDSPVEIFRATRLHVFEHACSDGFKTRATRSDNLGRETLEMRIEFGLELSHGLVEA